MLFFGVLYHLRHPLLGLEKVCALTKADGLACVESFVTDAEERATERHLEFYETDELGGQIDNWFGPTTACLAALCRSAGFVRAEQLYNDDRRAGVACYRRCQAVPTGAKPPLLAVAINNRHEDLYFSPGKDEYICLHFHHGEDLTRDDVEVEVGGFGAPALLVAPTAEDRWQANVRVPPGLRPGNHPVTIRVHGSLPSNAVKIALLRPSQDRPSGTTIRAGSISREAPHLVAVGNTMDGGTVFHGYRAEKLRCIFESSHSELDISSVEARIDDTPAATALVGRGRDEQWEIVLRLPQGLPAGRHEVRVRTFDSKYSRALPIQLNPGTDWAG